MKRARPRRRQGGVALIEVLVAVLIVSFGLLGLVGLQSRAVTFSVAAEDSNRAALVGNEIATALKLNLTSGGLLDPTSTAVTTAVGMAGTLLPNGVATVTPAGTPDKLKTITVQWKALTAPSGAAVSTYTTQVIAP